MKTICFIILSYNISFGRIQNVAVNIPQVIALTPELEYTRVTFSSQWAIEVKETLPEILKRIKATCGE